MKKVRIKNFITIGVAVIFSALLTLVLFFAVPSPVSEARETPDILDWDSNSLSAFSIYDLANANAITKVNYAPNYYAHPTEIIGGNIVDLSEKNEQAFARRGTFQFVFLNLDPMAKDYAAQAEKMKPLISGDGSYHLTLYLPTVQSACAVYINSVLILSAGDIADYNTIDYCNYYKKTAQHNSETKPTYLDLTFASRPESISPNRLEAAQIVTIHYESVEGGRAGFDCLPLVGANAAVRGIGSANSDFLIALSAIALLTSVSVALLCILKRSLRFLPQIAIGAAVFVWLVSELLKMGALSMPNLPIALAAGTIAVALVASLFSLKPTKKFKLCWIFAIFIAIMHAVTVFILPFTVVPVATFNIYNVVLSLIVSAFTLIFLILSALEQSDATMYLNPLFATLAAILSVSVGGRTFFAFSSPIVWISAVMIGVLIFVSFRVFVSTERRNRVLTSNLQSEVVRQTSELQTVVSERDKILSYVSHDMKKNSVSIGRFLTTVKEREKDVELKKTIDIALRKNREMTDEFTELAGFAKYNYLAEASAEFSARDILADVYNSVSPDCEANGIVLILEKVSKTHVWAKANGLKAVLKNIIFNAIEHADCKTITLSLSVKNNACRFHVTDDGKGIQTNRDIFAPNAPTLDPAQNSGELNVCKNRDNFAPNAPTLDPAQNSGELNVCKNRDIFAPNAPTLDPAQNSGFGLYICKNIVMSMGGNLSYSQTPTTLTFTITVPIG